MPPASAKPKPGPQPASDTDAGVVEQAMGNTARGEQPAPSYAAAAATPVRAAGGSGLAERASTDKAASGGAAPRGVAVARPPTIEDAVHKSIAPLLDELAKTNGELSSLRERLGVVESLATDRASSRAASADDDSGADG